MPMDLRKLELFVAVVDEGGFTAAAEAVHVAQPSVSQAVRELEREVGADLVVRSRRGAVPTAAGLALLGPARRALREVAAARDAVADVVGLVGGRLDVAALPTLAADPLAGLVGRFRRDHPAVTVGLLAPADPFAVADAVRSGRAELGISEAGTTGGPDLIEIPLGAQELVAVAPAGTRLPAGPLRIERLRDVPLVLPPRGTSLRASVEDACAVAGVEPLVAVETEQRDALVPLALAGAGTTFVPAGVGAAAAAQGAVVRPTRPRLARELVVLHRADHLGPAGRAFVSGIVGASSA
jgi:LysR family transcriptional regulator, carnitine catabolism transcriptional activator